MAKGYRKARPASIPDGNILVLYLDPLRVRRKENREVRKGSYVYAIKSGQHVKFGSSKSPWARVDDIQVGCPEQCELVFLVNCGKEFARSGVEKAIHLALERSHVRGEWFDASSPGVKRLLETPWALPWSVIEGMIRLGLRAYFPHSPYPKHVRASVEEKKVEAVKTQFPSYLSQIP